MNLGLPFHNDLSAFNPESANASELSRLYAEKRAAVQLNPEQQKAFELLKDGKNIFVSGGVSFINLMIAKIWKRSLTVSYL
jgi:hypothetical protein